MAAIIFLALDCVDALFLVGDWHAQAYCIFCMDYHYQNMKKKRYLPYLHLMGSGACCCGDMLCLLCSSVVPKGVFLPVLFGGLLPKSGYALPVSL